MFQSNYHTLFKQGEEDMEKVRKRERERDRENNRLDINKKKNGI